MFKFILFFIGFTFITIAIIVRFFPKLLLKIAQKLFKKMYNIQNQPKSNKDTNKKVIFEKKNPKNEQGYSDYDIIDEDYSPNKSDN